MGATFTGTHVTVGRINQLDDEPLASERLTRASMTSSQCLVDRNATHGSGARSPIDTPDDSFVHPVTKEQVGSH